MAINQFEDLRPVFITRDMLESEGEISMAIAKTHADLLPEDIRAIPVKRITEVTIRGVKTVLPKLIHIYECLIPSECTTVKEGVTLLFYWKHDALSDTLRPYPGDTLEYVAEAAISEVEALTAKEILEAVKAPEPVVAEKPTIVGELPSVDETSLNPDLIKELPNELQVQFGDMLYDKRWYTSWHAKMMVTGAGYKKLYNGVFLSLKGGNKVIDEFAPYLWSGRFVEKIIDERDMAVLGITDVELGAWKG